MLNKWTLVPNEDLEAGIILALQSKGGAAPRRIVYEDVGDMLQHDFNQRDREIVDCWDNQRWHRRLDARRADMIRRGLMSADAAHGIWMLA